MTKKIKEEEVIFEEKVLADDELLVTESQLAETDIKTALDAVDGVVPDLDPDVALMQKLRNISTKMLDSRAKVKSDGSTASYYELPEEAKELQHLISFKDMNAQMGEIFRAVYRYGQVEHSEKIRDAKKIKYYIDAEIERLTKYGS